MDIDRAYHILRKIVDTPSVSGFTEPVRPVIKDFLKEYVDEVREDVMGNVIGVMKGSSDFKVMIAAHMDQIGFIVRDIGSNGEIYFAPVGGWDSRVIYGRRVVIHTEKGEVTGVIAVKPPHLLRYSPEEAKKAPDIKNMVIDVGVGKKEEAESLGVRVGDPITLDTKTKRLGNNKATGAGFDDKACVAAMVIAAEKLAQEDVEPTVYLVATEQEEVGLRGARTATFSINPDVGIAMDVTHAVAPGVPANLVSGISLGKGPAIGIGPNFSKKLWRLICKVAEEEKIPYQLEPIPGPSGTDANAMQVTRGGVYTGLISLPLRYMHSAVEMLSLDDLVNTGRLAAATVKRITPTEYPRPKPI